MSPYFRFSISTSQLLLAVFASGFSTPAAQTSTDSVAATTGIVIIEAVEVSTYSVFPPTSPEYDSWYADAANRVHVATRSSVIERELLFQPGDTLDHDLLAETERNLRSYAFLDSVAISAFTLGDRAVVRVYTDDNWTLSGGLILKGGGGYSEIGAEVVERNLLGLGKDFRLALVHTTDFDYVSGAYLDPQLLGTRWRTTLQGAMGKEFQTTSLAIHRPFFARHVAWSGGVNGGWSSGDRTLYTTANGRTRIPMERVGMSGWITRAWQRRKLRTELNTNLALSANIWPGEKPNPKEVWQDTLNIPWETITASVRMRFEPSRRWINLRQIDLFGRRESVALGPALSLGGGIVKGVRGTPYISYPFVQLSLSQTAYRKPNLLRGNISTHAALLSDVIDGGRGWSHTRLNMGLRYFYQGLPFQTLAARVEYRNLIRNSRSYRRLYLDGRNGLRGYQTWQFIGTSSLLVSVEDRIFTPLKIMTVEFGIVAFADAGYVWKEGQKKSLRDLHPSAGVGIRLGSTKAAGAQITRIDLAFPLRGGFGFSLNYGFGQSFSK